MHMTASTGLLNGLPGTFKNIMYMAETKFVKLFIGLIFQFV